MSTTADGKILKTPVRPPRVGSPVEELRPRDPHLGSVMLKNHSGYDMATPVYIGKVMGSESLRPFWTWTRSSPCTWRFWEPRGRERLLS
ncbi:MAG: hypothetical protein Q9N34_01040 [Aquificota bacterium]|nr:hypothetical protein [Aquificota bacterium]